MAIYSFVRSKKRDSYNTMEKNINRVQPRFEKYNNATILPNYIANDSDMFGVCGVINENNDYVELSKTYREFDGRTITDECDIVHKNVVYLGPIVKQWGHYLTDSISRLWYFLNYDDEVDQYVFSAVVGDVKQKITGNYYALLSLLGIADKTVIINKPTKFDSVVVPEIGIKKAELFSYEYGDIFRRCTENVMKDTIQTVEGKRVFLSRSKLHFSQESGNREIDNYFRKNGFEVVYPEKETLQTLIKKMSGAEYIASVSGSTAHNLVFANKNSKCIIIEKCALANEYQVSINMACNLNVTYIDANISLLPVRPGSGPFIVCANKYLELFSKQNNFKYQSRPRKIRGYVRNYWQRYFDTYYTYPDSWVCVDRFDSIKEAYDESLSLYSTKITKVTALQRLKNFVFTLLKNH